MHAALEAVRPIELAEIRRARKRIANSIVRTPLVRLELGRGYPDIRLKIESLQPTNSYKMRGAANAVAMLSEPERRCGVWTSAPVMQVKALRLPRAEPACHAQS